MGAVHKVDLTADVTHLIVGNTDTPKYRYVAKERPDIKVLTPEWLDTVRDSWLQGGETDVLALEEEHTLPSLLGLQICVTGFDNLKERNDIAEAVEANGARYHGDLTKQVTHLIAAAPRGKKYEYAGQWGVKIIAIEWLRDSLKRGMVLDETLYSPTTPAEERGRRAISEYRPQAALRKRSRDGESQTEAGDGGRRKLRRTTSSKLQSQNGELWADIGQGEKESAYLRVDQWAEPTRQPPAPNQTSRSQPHIASHAGEGESCVAGDGQVSAGAKEAQATSWDKTHIFKDHRMFILGFEPQKTQVLQDFVSSNGADVLSREVVERRALYLEESTTEISNHDRTKATTYVVPHDISSEKLADLRGQSFLHEQDDLVTDWWVEKCIYLKTHVNTNGPLCKPLDKLPIEGAHYDEYLRENTSVLVCNNGTMPNAQKLKYALEHQIPVVRSEWMWECITTGQCLPLADFSLTARKPPKESQRRTLKRTETAPAMPIVNTLSLTGKGIDDANKKPKESSQPLQELDTKTNSPKKGSTTNSARASFSRPLGAQKAAARDADSATQGTDENGEYQTPVGLDESRGDDENRSTRLNDAIAELRAHRARDASTSNQNQATTSDRRHRPLGRAISNPSSLGGGAGSTLGTAGSRPTSTSRNKESTAEEHEQHNRPQSFLRKQSESFTFHPSQALTYEREESAKTREMLTERMGLGGGDERMRQDGNRNTQGGMQRVESIGKVKDLVSAGAGAVEGASRKRQRRAVRPAQ
ncbi:MAG: hypothetical protein M1831_004250 [Alyxoria varia]|nr:MAG: hypothetical protein M1831_004250 [Alyxoria varia]